MLIIESTSGCPRTPVLLFGLEEAGVPYELEFRPDGYFQAQHGEAGPTMREGAKLSIGLLALLERVANLPALVPASPDERERAQTWVVRLSEVRQSLAQLASAKKTGQVPAAGHIETVQRFAKDLEAALSPGPWVLGATFSFADVALSVTRGMAAMGLAVGPSTERWLLALAARPAFVRALAAMQKAALLAPPAL